MRKHLFLTVLILLLSGAGLLITLDTPFWIKTKSLAFTLDRTGHKAYEWVFGSPQVLQAGWYYTCPMHPQIHLSHPGKCPICGATLVKKQEGKGAQQGYVSFTPREIQVGGVRVERLRKRDLVKTLDVVGSIEYNEKTLAYVTSRINGRVDKLFVNFTGETIDPRHPLVWIYSPQLVSAQEEYLLALQTSQAFRSFPSSGGLPNHFHSSEDGFSLLEAARQRLLLWGIDKNQIAQLKKTKKVTDHLTVYAPLGGTILKKNVFEGQYVKEGDVLFEIADLSTVWLYADVYEPDIGLLLRPHPGDYYQCPMHQQIKRPGPGLCPICGMPLLRHSPALEADITTKAYPGKTFHGVVEFVYPWVNPATRTLRLRISIPNPDLSLRPDMYARVRILIDLGKKLAVPESAILYSGKRNMAFVDEGEGRLAPRLVTLGDQWLYDKNFVPSEEYSLPFSTGLNRFHEVLGGLKKGDLVVVSGNFVVDAESQLQGALSKLAGEEPEESTEKTTPSRWAVPPSFNTQLQAVYSTYFTLEKALNLDHFEDSQKKAQNLLDALNNVDMSLLKGNAHTAWMAENTEMKKDTTEVIQSQDIKSLRVWFSLLSDPLLRIAQKFDVKHSTPLFYFYCPMALNEQGAHWLQPSLRVENPYLGQAMPTCGDLKETLPSSGGTNK